MKVKLTSAMVLLLVICAIVVCAQQSRLTIAQLREEIQKRETLDIPEDLKELNRNRLNELRALLLTLLVKELERLAAYKAGLTMTIAEARIVDDRIQAYQAERKKLEDALPSATLLASSSPSFLPTETPLAPPSTAPPQSPNAVPTPTPAIAAVSADAGTNNQTTQATCADLNALSDSQKNAKVISQVDYKLCDLVSAVKARPNRQIRLTGAGAPDYFDLLVIMIAKKSTPAFLVEAEEARVDKQVGSSPASSGTTSLVVKGGAPAILGFAVENGALTETSSGTTFTFRGNPLGIFQALADHGFIDSYIKDENDLMTRFMRKTSFAFSFDTDRGSQPGVFTADKQQLSSVSGRIEFINKRRPSLYTKEWNDFLGKQAQQFANTVNSSISALVTTEITAVPLEWRDPVLQAWFAETQSALSGATADGVEAVLRAQLDKLPVSELAPQTIAQLNGIENQIGVYLSGRDALLDKIAKGTLVTFDYTNNREVNSPDTSNFTLIAEKGPGGRADLTFNGSLTIFNKKPVLLNNNPANRIGRIRDFNFAGQFDVPFGSVRGAGQFVLWFSGSYKRLLENGFTQAGTMVPNTKGDLAVGQVGLKIPIKGLGMKIPLSFSFANRTDLIKEKEIRGNFGFTFDLDTIFAKFKPF